RKCLELAIPPLLKSALVETELCPLIALHRLKSVVNADIQTANVLTDALAAASSQDLAHLVYQCGIAHGLAVQDLVHHDLERILTSAMDRREKEMGRRRGLNLLDGGLVELLQSCIDDAHGQTSALFTLATDFVKFGPGKDFQVTSL